MRPEILSFFADYIEKESGIVYSRDNYFQLESRLQEFVKIQGEVSVEHLYEKARVSLSGSLKQTLLDLATNNETFFFRDMKVFKAIESEVIEKLRKNEGASAHLRVWSAASSTGQEALSVAMLIREFNLQHLTNLSYSIVATDISERVLQRARSGLYTQLEVQRGLPATFLLKYFQKTENDQWRVSSDILKNIAYKKMNLKESFSFVNKFHLVLCRNVLIYQSVESKMKIIERISEMLEPGGALILGTGESLLGLSEDFEQQIVEGAVVYRKKITTSLAA